MRILFVDPNYHSGGAEIAGNRPPSWAAYLTGYLKAPGYTEIAFIDAMTDHLDEDALCERIRAYAPDLIGTTAITPAISKAERVLALPREECPQALTVLGGVHGTFLSHQVLGEAPWVDVVVRGEGEAVLLDLVRALEDGRWARDRRSVRGIATMIVDSTGRRPRSEAAQRSSGWSSAGWAAM